MNFEYTAYIYINEDDLRTMYKRVKAGEKFPNVYQDIMSEYDDCDYYACDNIIDQVEAEINHRLKQTKINKENCEISL